MRHHAFNSAPLCLGVKTDWLSRIPANLYRRLLLPVDSPAVIIACHGTLRGNRASLQYLFSILGSCEKIVARVSTSRK